MVDEVTHFSFAVPPEVNGHADKVIDCRVCALIQQSRSKRTEREDKEPDLDAAVEQSPRERLQGPLPGQSQQSEQDVDDL